MRKCVAAESAVYSKVFKDFPLMLMRMRRQRIGVWVLAITMAASAVGIVEAADEELIPPASPKYMGREIAQTMHYEGASWLTRESRDREEDCATLLAALN